MTENQEDIKLTKSKKINISKVNENALKSNKTKGKTISSINPKKNIPLKQLNFNPLSFMPYKYPPKTFTLMNIKKIDENLRNNNTLLNNLDKENRKNIFSVNINKIKLKPLTKSSSCSQLFQRCDDICFPSNKMNQDIIKYNLSNMHNTILNFYHKNPRNQRIINFVRINSFNPNNISNNISNSMNKNISLNKTSYNDSAQISKNDIMYNNIKIDSANSSSNLNIKNNVNYPNISSIPKDENSNIKISTKKNKKQKKIDYELEMVDKRYAHNLRFFSNQLFEDNIKRNKTASKNNNKNSNNTDENSNNFFEKRNNSNLAYQVMDFKGKRRLVATNLTNKNRKLTLTLKNKKKEDFHHIMKNPFGNSIGEKNEKMNPLEHNNLAKKIQHLILNPNVSKVRNKDITINNKLNNNDKNTSYEDIREISKKGFKRMKAETLRRFNLLVENTNKEVIQLEKKLDELLEVNKQLFLDAKDE